MQVSPSYELGTAVIRRQLHVTTCGSLLTSLKEISARAEAEFLIFLKKRLLEESSRKHSWGRNYFKDKFKHRPRQRAVL